MKIIDQHTHSQFSFDSTESIENYLKMTDNPIVTTEHLDFSDPTDDYTDRIPDYEAYQKEIRRLNTLYDKRVYAGIEIGWAAISQEKILAYLQDKDYAIKLLSIHQNGQADYMSKTAFTDYDPERIITEYFTLIKEALLSFGDHVDVLAHFDYAFRLTRIEARDLENYGLALFETICKLIIEKEIAFELNTSSAYRHHNTALYEWALSHYIRLGGKKVSLSSDAHRAKDYQRNFSEAVELLKKHKIERLVSFIGPEKEIIL